MMIEKGHTMKISQRVIRLLCLFGLWLGLGLQAHAQTDTVTYVYTDPQGTPLVKADASGNVIARYDYTPYGNAVTSLGSPPDGPGYTGHVNDPETGLVYMQARYYQPDGRFLSPDPVTPSAGALFGFNRYVYVDNNPINKVDRDGRCGVGDCVAVVIFLGSVISGAIDTAIQEWNHPNQPVDKKEVAISAAAGGLSAGSGSILSGMVASEAVSVGGAVIGQAAVNSTLGAASSAANDLAHGRKVSVSNATKAAVVNGVVSLAASGLSVKAGDFNEASANNALVKMSRAPVDAPEGVGSAIASATRSAGTVGKAQTTLQAATSQAGSAALGAAGDEAENKLDKGN